VNYVYFIPINHDIKEVQAVDMITKKKMIMAIAAIIVAISGYYFFVQDWNAGFYIAAKSALLNWDNENKKGT